MEQVRSLRFTNTILGRMQTAAPCGTCQGSGQLLDQKPAGADAQGLNSERRNGFDPNSWRS